jgi:hypothetical protein
VAVIIAAIIFILLVAVAIFVFVRNHRLTASYSRLKEELGGSEYELQSREDQIGTPDDDDS